MKPHVQLTLGFTIAVALLLAALWLWLHNVIIVAAPVGALALGVAWAVVDNTMIYPAERARRQAETAPGDPGTLDVPGTAAPPPATERREITAPH